ncbi:MAG TPA: anthrone oxygenase family protein [Streptomyces sp.]|nr:anthrone oxygenase family protein [Streptomyces sp.]
MAPVLLGLAIVSAGLYAGFMLIFLTGIMPALARLTDEQFVAAMRRINEDVPRGVFVTVMFASVAFPVAAVFVPVDDRNGAETALLIAGTVCVFLNHVITAAGNIPLNNELAASEARGAADHEVREAFEARWNRLHLVRTLLVTAGFALVVASAL